MAEEPPGGSYAIKYVCMYRALNCLQRFDFFLVDIRKYAMAAILSTVEL